MPNVLVFFSERRCAVLFFREISCVQHQNRLNTFVSSEEQKPLPQPTSEKPVACHACNDDDCSKNRKCYEENTGNHLAPLSHSQRLLLERFHIVLMMPMVVMVDVFVIVMSASSFSIYVHWLNIFLTVHCKRQGHIEGNNSSYNSSCSLWSHPSLHACIALPCMETYLQSLQK